MPLWPDMVRGNPVTPALIGLPFTNQKLSAQWATVLTWNHVVHYSQMYCKVKRDVQKNKNKKQILLLERGKGEMTKRLFCGQMCT